MNKKNKKNSITQIITVHSLVVRDYYTYIIRLAQKNRFEEEAKIFKW